MAASIDIRAIAAAVADEPGEGGVDIFGIVRAIGGSRNNVAGTSLAMLYDVSGSGGSDK